MVKKKPNKKNLPEMQETWVKFLDGEDSLEKGMATHSNILAWRIPWVRGAWWATVQEVVKSRTWLSDWTTTEARPEQRSNTMWLILEGSEMLAGQWHGDMGGGRQRGVWYIFSNHREQPEYHSSRNTWEVVNNACPRNIPAKAWRGWATYPTPSSYWLGPPLSAV